MKNLVVNNADDYVDSMAVSGTSGAIGTCVYGAVSSLSILLPIPGFAVAVLTAGVTNALLP
jgi:hypothetical protein